MRRRNITAMVTLMAVVALAACGSDDDSGSGAAADTTAPTTTEQPVAPTIAAPTTVAPTTVAPTTVAAPASTAPESTVASSDLGDTPDCLVGSWVIDGPAWVSNASAATGESMRYVSGQYVYEFADDGTYTVSVEGFTIEIDGEDGPVRAESIGTEEGLWYISVLTRDEIAVIDGLDRADVDDLPHVYVESTAVNVSETAIFMGTRVDLGAVDQDQGIEGLGPIDCSSNTLMIRAVSPVAVDVSFSRL